MFEAYLQSLVEPLPTAVLFLVIGGSLFIIVKGADLLVDHAVGLSIRWGVPKMLIGATIVSIGTTLPETAVSVFAAIKGSPGLALGNAVGSIIANTGLILGLAVLLGSVPVERRLVNRQSWIQVGSAVLLVVVSVPYRATGSIMVRGGGLPQWAGAAFLIILGVYLWRSITWSRSEPGEDGAESSFAADQAPRAVTAPAEMVFGVVMVVFGSRVLIPAVEVTAVRLGTPEAIIAATLVAFGTSLPELATAITAVRKGHGELAIGNVLGANVLNVLFVSGAAAAVTRGGLAVPPEFYTLYFPSMLFVIAVLRIGIVRAKGELGRGLGIALLLAYAVTVVAGYVV